SFGRMRKAPDGSLAKSLRGRSVHGPVCVLPTESEQRSPRDVEGRRAMQSKHENTDSASRTSRASPTTPDAPAPLKRFRIERLEERIAPTKGGKGTHNCSSGSSTSSGSLSTVSIF